MPKPDRSWIWLAALCLCAFLHSLLYVVTNPVFEWPDEPGHLAYANYVASGRGVPNMEDPKSQVPEGHQTPLYYWIAGSILRLTGGPISVDLPPSGIGGQAPLFNHKLNPFRGPRDRDLYYTLKLFGCVLVAATTCFVGRAARSLMPVGHVWMIAPMWIAMLPQFAFIGGSISNDGLVAFFASSALFAAAWCNRKPDHLKPWLTFGSAIGLAFLSKKSGLTLVPCALIFACVLVLSRRSQPYVAARNCFACLLAAAVFIVPILVRNQFTYGELLANRMEMDATPQLVYFQGLRSPLFRFIFPDMVPRSLIAHLGWMTVEVRQNAVWNAFRALALPAALSFFAFLDRSRAAMAAYCWAAVFTALAGLVYYNMSFPQAQGRLLFPALGALVVMSALGWHEVSRRVPVPHKWIVIAAGFVGLLWFDCLVFFTNQSFYDFYVQQVGR